MKKTTYLIKGIAPLLMHNGQLADPLNDAAKALARLTQKKGKTDADHLAVRKCEWYGGIYVDAAGAPCLPGDVIEAALVEGARKIRMGKAVKGALIVRGDIPLGYTGPKTADGLWKAGGFIKLAGIVVGKNRVIRSRPMFPEWTAQFTVDWDDEIIKDLDQLDEIVEAAGHSGIGDWRPKYGRFEVENAS